AVEQARPRAGPPVRVAGVRLPRRARSLLGVVERAAGGARADHQQHARALPGADEAVAGAGRAVQEVPSSDPPLLAIDAGDALALEDEEVLLRRVGVVETARFARLEDRELDPELAEALRLEVGPLAQHRHVCLEDAPRAEGLVRDPRRVADVDDEPAAADRREPRADVGETSLYRNRRTPT